MQFEIVKEFEERYLIEIFSEDSYIDPDDPSKLYTYTTTDLSNKEVITCFIEEVLEGNIYEDLHSIQKSNAPILLRQMAMFRKINKGKKEQENSSTEAKLYATQLLNIMGNQTKYYTNVDSIESPHDAPGLVTHNAHLHTQHDSICFIAINEQHFLFIEQTWNYRGE